MLKKITSNVAWLSGDQILRLAISFFIGAWTARYLQPKYYGLLNYGFAIIGLFVPFANLNDLNQIVIRDITCEPAIRDKLLGTTFILKLIGSTAAIFLSVGCVLIMRPDDQLAQLIVVILSVSLLSYPFSAIDAWFQSQLQVSYTVIAKNIIFIVITFVRIGLIYFHASLINFAVAISAEAILGSTALVIAYRIQGYRLSKWHFDFSTANHLLKDGWALILSGFAISIYLKIDQSMLGQMVGDYSVGLYSVAVRLSEICALLPTAIVASVTPAIIAAKQRSEDEFYAKLQKLFDLMVLFSLGFVILVTLFSSMAIGIVYGKEYQGASGILTIHVWSLCFMCFGISKSIWVIAENQGLYTLIVSFLGALINILLNLYLIPKYQATGAAVATLISYAFTDYVTCFFYAPARKIGFMITRSIACNSFILTLSKNLLKNLRNKT